MPDDEREESADETCCGSGGGEEILSGCFENTVERSGRSRTGDRESGEASFFFLRLAINERTVRYQRGQKTLK